MIFNRKMGNHNSSAISPKKIPLVFLGGSCCDNMYREHFAIPMFTKAGIKYYNPKVAPGEWKESMIQEENEAKDKADIILMIIDGDTRGIMSMLEACEYIVLGRNIVLCIDNVTKYEESENKDINRGRAYLRDIAKKHHISIYSTIEEAVTSIIQTY